MSTCFEIKGNKTVTADLLDWVLFSSIRKSLKSRHIGITSFVDNTWLQILQMQLDESPQLHQSLPWLLPS